MHYHCVIVLLHERINCLYTGSYTFQSLESTEHTTAASSVTVRT